PKRLVTTPPIVLSSIWTAGAGACGCWALVGRPAASTATAITNIADDTFEARMFSPRNLCERSVPLRSDHLTPHRTPSINARASKAWRSRARRRRVGGNRHLIREDRVDAI